MRCLPRSGPGLGISAHLLPSAGPRWSILASACACDDSLGQPQVGTEIRHSGYRARLLDSGLSSNPGLHISQGPVGAHVVGRQSWWNYQAVVRDNTLGTAQSGCERRGQSQGWGAAVNGRL